MVLAPAIVEFWYFAISNARKYFSWTYIAFSSNIVKLSSALHRSSNKSMKWKIIFMTWSHFFKHSLRSLSPPTALHIAKWNETVLLYLNLFNCLHTSYYICILHVDVRHMFNFNYQFNFDLFSGFDREDCEPCMAAASSHIQSVFDLETERPSLYWFFPNQTPILS